MWVFPMFGVRWDFRYPNITQSNKCLIRINYGNLINSYQTGIPRRCSQLGKPVDLNKLRHFKPSYSAWFFGLPSRTLSKGFVRYCWISQFAWFQIFEISTRGSRSPCCGFSVIFEDMTERTIKFPRLIFCQSPLTLFLNEWGIPIR